jgi:hypothetical protein
MACKVLQLSGWLDGEHPIDTAGTDHVAGQAAKLTASGWELALLPKDVLGVFKNDMVDEVAGGPQAADAPAAGYSNGTVVMGENKLELSPGFLKTGATQTPFKYPGTHTWAIGNRIFLATDGTWDNAPGTTNDPPFGVVTKPPTSATDTLECVIDPMNGALYSAVTT